MGLYDKNNHNIIEEKFATKEEVLELIEKYHPTIISDLNGTIGEISYPKQKLDFVKIVSYYDNEEGKNPHLVNPNYLKLPQALEVKND